MSEPDGSKRPEPGEWFFLAGALFYRFHGSLRMRVGNLGHCFQARRCLSGSIDPCDDDEWVRERDVQEVYRSDWMAQDAADALDVDTPGGAGHHSSAADRWKQRCQLPRLCLRAGVPRLP